MREACRRLAAGGVRGWKLALQFLRRQLGDYILNTVAAGSRFYKRPGEVAGSRSYKRPGVFAAGSGPTIPPASIGRIHSQHRRGWKPLLQETWGVRGWKPVLQFLRRRLRDYILNTVAAGGRPCRRPGVFAGSRSYKSGAAPSSTGFYRQRNLKFHTSTALLPALLSPSRAPHTGNELPVPPAAPTIPPASIGRLHSQHRRGWKPVLQEAGGGHGKPALQKMGFRRGAQI